jgi:hypothetical protein
MDCSGVRRSLLKRVPIFWGCQPPKIGECTKLWRFSPISGFYAPISFFSNLTTNIWGK